MAFWLTLAGTAFVLLGIYTYTLQFSYRNMPPGPLVLPILGTIFSVATFNPGLNLRDLINFKAYEYFHTASKMYGSIYSQSVGMYQAVVLTSYDIIKQVENMDEYSIKVSNDLTTYRSMGEELGLVFAATPELWGEMRKFSQRTLRDFGFGKRYSMQSVIEVEISDIMAVMRREMKHSDGILKIRTTFLLSVLNVLWCMIAGHRYSHDDPKLTSMMQNNFAMIKAQTFVDPLVLLIPLLRNIFPNVFKWNLVSKVFEESHDFSRSLIEERKQVGAHLSEPQNYIDCFLKKIHETEAQNRRQTDKKKNTRDGQLKSPVYSIKNLQMMIEDFMQTGSTTTNGTLNYALLFLTLHPEVQKRCQEEIDFHVPCGLIPTLDDIEKMPYFQATILETHRLGNVVPIPIPRQTPSDWKLKGYLIPKGTIIVSNHYSIQMDEDYWKDPHNFRPERFINEKGEYVPDKRVCQFGFGKRYCIGVTLVNSVVPIYIATLLQNFNFGIVPGTKPPTMDPELGVSLSPKEFSVLVTERINGNQKRPGK